jgi:hypothetical protein
VPVAVEVNRRSVRHNYGVLGVNLRKLTRRRLEHRRMSHHNEFRSDRPIADEELRPAASNLVADAWIHGPEPGQ